MTSVTRTEAIIEKFPFLKEHIPDFTKHEDGTFAVEFLPFSEGIFLSKKREGNDFILLYFYNKEGEQLPEIGYHTTVEQHILSLRYVPAEVHYVVKHKPKGLQVYIPPSNTCFVPFMNEMLQKERQKAKDDLKNTLANLYTQTLSSTVRRRSSIGS